ncbi:MAG TPA: hypothetical protein VGA20_08400 [Gemmatimonadales bacterium]
MKRLSHLLAGALVVAAFTTPVAAQSGPRFEIGGFGTYTRYDAALTLEDRIGGGGRIAFHFNRFLGIEVMGAFLGPSTTAGSASNFFHLGSGSLLLGGGGSRFSVFALGGYSRLDMGSTAPYNYGVSGFHGGAGFRIGVTNRLALRVDGRAILVSDDQIASGSVMHLIGTAGLSLFTGGGRRPQPEQPAPAPIVAPAEPQPVEPQPVEPQPVEPQPVEPRPEPARPRPAARPPTEARARVRQSRLLPHGEQIEVSLLGTFTRYDRAFELGNQFGAGLRIGYFLSDRLNLELEGAFSNPTSNFGGTASMSIGGASLAYNFRFGNSALYLLGGYSRVTWAENYDFADNMFHGGLGGRFFLTNSVALRLEGRALYSPQTNGPPPWAGHVIGSAGLSFLASPPRQVGAVGVGGRAYQWYWGGQGGVFLYKTNLLPFYYDPVIGGHWMITAKRTSLYLAYEQAFFLTDAKALIFDPSAEATGLAREINFSDMRRIMFGVMAHPAQKVIEPLGGLGFAMMQVLNPTPDCTSDCETIAKATEAFDRAEDAASKAFFWLMGGIQMNYSNRLNVFGHYFLTSSSRNFLIEGNTHTIQGGIRYSFGSAKEGLTERN